MFEQCSPQSIHGSPQNANAPAAAVIGWSKWSDNVKTRSPFILSGLLLCLAGFVINVADVSIGVKYFGTFLVVIGSYAGFPGNVSWCVTALCSFSKRSRSSWGIAKAWEQRRWAL